MLLVKVSLFSLLFTVSHNSNLGYNFESLTLSNIFIIIAGVESSLLEIKNNFGSFLEKLLIGIFLSIVFVKVGLEIYRVREEKEPIQPQPEILPPTENLDENSEELEWVP